MRRLLRRRPSPAMIVAIAALVVASAGSATAATVIIRNSTQIERGSVNTGDLANNRGVSLGDLTPRTRQALAPLPGPQGAQGDQGPQGPAGARGERGPQGERGLDGTAIAYAAVNADGTLDAENSRNVRSSIRNGITYCLDLDVRVRNAVASVEHGGGNFGDVILPTLPLTPSGESFVNGACAGTGRLDVAVRIVDLLAGNFPQRRFYIAFN